MALSFIFQQFLGHKRELLEHNASNIKVMGWIHRGHRCWEYVLNKQMW